MKKLILLLLVLHGPALAEDDGDELLGMMETPATRQVALVFIDDVIAEWDGGVFCVARGNPWAPEDAQAAAFVAVRTYLESYPRERYRARRYLITQALRAAFPCAPR